MLRFTLLCALLFLCRTGAVNGQERDVLISDSLERRLEQSRDRMKRITILTELSDHWLYEDSAKAMEYALAIGDLHKSSADPVGQGIGWYQVGSVFMEHNNQEKALESFEEAKNLLETDPSKVSKGYLARVWHNIGAIRQRQGDSKAFMAILLEKANPLLESIDDTLHIGQNYFDIGWLFMNQKQYEKGYEYFLKATKELEHFPHSDFLPEGYLAAVQALIYNEDAGRHMVDDAASTAKDLMKRSRQLLEKYSYTIPWLRYYVVSGLVSEFFDKDFNTAVKAYQAGYALAEEKKQFAYSEEFLNRQYYAHIELQDFNQARESLEHLYRRVKHSPVKSNLSLALENLVSLEERSGNKEKAFEYLKEKKLLDDSLRLDEQAVQLAELEKKYAQEKTQREVLELRSQNRQKTIILIVLAGLGLLGYQLYRNKQQLARQQANLHKEQLERLEKEQQLSFYTAMIKGQEQERKRLAQDLHDGLGGLLSNIKLMLSKDGDRSQLLKKLDDAVDELRRIARNMMPETLIRFGLVPALKDYCKGLEKSGVKISLQTYGVSDEIAVEKQITIYRIVQELVNNAVKHARSANILVQCVQEDRTFLLTVEDDGNGFDVDIEEGKGVGIVNVKNRVAYLKGNVDIQSERAVGTTINIEFNV